MLQKVSFVTLRQFLAATTLIAALGAVSCGTSEDPQDVTINIDIQVPDFGGCVPATCESLQAECGTPQDGCGNALSCGECEVGSCEDFKCRTICIPQCFGKCCGDDGCGGACTDNCALNGQECDTETCTCGAACPTRTTCQDLGKNCGTWDDGCGGTQDCGTCTTGECVDGACQEPPPEGLNDPCPGGDDDCSEAFPVCAPVGEGFCSKECTKDADCGSSTCCVMTGQKKHCMAPDNDFVCSDPSTQTGCPGGYNCMPVQNSACTFCYEVGEIPAGGQCNYVNDCVKGYLCTKSTGEATSTCKKLCNAKAGTGCPGGQTCGGLTGVTDWGICRTGPATCNPANNGNDCPEGQSCYGGSGCTSFTCGQHGSLGLGAECTYSDDCGKGMICGNGVCMQMCGNGSCPEGFDCVDVSGCTGLKVCAGQGGTACTIGKNNEPCGANEMCYPLDADCSQAGCYQAGTAGPNESCTNINDCQKGYLCANDGSGGTCLKACWSVADCSPPYHCEFMGNGCGQTIGSCSNVM
ncbi:MAG TPA: hypothetical protein PLB35_11200 [Myxococcota bacterium]|nr:hypothetical protein [Myxococcota bacterium]HOH77809.1 hypothetical protein [Myxococcota bacterium]